MYHSINMEIRSIWPIILNKPHWPWVTSAIFDKDAKLVAPMVKNPPAMQEIQVRSLGWKIPWRKERLPTPVFLPRESHGQRNLEGYSPWGRKELNMTKWLTLLHKLLVNRHRSLWRRLEGRLTAYIFGSVTGPFFKESPLLWSRAQVWGVIKGLWLSVLTIQVRLLFTKPRTPPFSQIKQDLT